MTDANANQPPSPGEDAPPSTPPLAEQIVELSALTGGLAHEIRNPLSTLKVNLQLLDEDWHLVESANRDPKDVARRSRKRIATLLDEADHLSRILDDFLLYVGKRELQRTNADLNNIVTELADFFRPKAAATGVSLRVHLAEQPVLCSIDVGIIKQAVFNLFVNAQQAMPDGGEIAVHVFIEEDKTARLDVIDTGPGIPPEDQERVFHAYVSTKKGGTGLGLAMTRRFIRDHGGDIRLHSSPPNGSRFTILLPLVK